MCIRDRVMVASNNFNELRIIHGSLDTFMSDEKNKSDVENLLELDPDVLALTETGEVDMVRIINAVCKKSKTHIMVNPDVGDITFCLSKRATLVTSGGDIVIPAVHKPARDGGHGPRCN